MVRPWIAIVVMVLALAPMIVRLVLVRRARRRVHMFDDVIAYLGLPLMWLLFVVDFSPITTVVICCLGAAIVVVSVWRTISEYLRTRASQASR
jgi:hypothetical protein